MEAAKERWGGTGRANHASKKVRQGVRHTGRPMGETPCAFIEAQSGVSLTKEQVIEHCRELLVYYKGTRHVVNSELPKTSTSKIQKCKLG